MQTTAGSVHSQDAMASERAEFIRKTYTHLALAILAFCGIEYALLQLPFAVEMARIMTSGWLWLAVLGAFMAVSYLAEKLAFSASSREVQYLGLGLYVAAEAVLFLPLILVAVNYSTPDLLPTAALITGLMFTGLSFVVFTTKKDFSMLGGVLKIGGFVALGLIAASILFGFTLGLVFSGAMVVFASASILYNTSRVMRDYPSDKYVAGALALFASVALLFWYILRILIALGDD